MGQVLKLGFPIVNAGKSHGGPGHRVPHDQKLAGPAEQQAGEAVSPRGLAAFRQGVVALVRR